MKVCDFISAMDTARIPEWNCWYHLMNCGFPLKVSGETDFPCISGSRVGQGRVFTRCNCGKVDRIDYGQWCDNIARGKSYVSDGYAHALDFTVNGKTLGEEVKLDEPAPVKVKTKVAFASSLPLGTSIGGKIPQGDTRKVEIIVNGRVAASREVPADDKVHDLEFTVPITKSCWVVLRQFPSLHTNPVNVIVANAPIRASKLSARWCIEVIDQLWNVRGQGSRRRRTRRSQANIRKGKRDLSQNRRAIAGVNSRTSHEFGLQNSVPDGGNRSATCKRLNREWAHPTSVRGQIEIAIEIVLFILPTIILSPAFRRHFAKL